MQVDGAGDVDQGQAANLPQGQQGQQQEPAVEAGARCRATASSHEIVKCDPKTGKSLARHPVPGGGGLHGMEFAGGTLWVTSLRIQKLSQIDPKDFRLIHQIPVHLGRAHGLAWDNGAIWCMHSTDRVIHKLDPKDGALLEVVTLSKEDPDPHGLCLFKGHLYYCDARAARATRAPRPASSAGLTCNTGILACLGVAFHHGLLNRAPEVLARRSLDYASI